MAPRNCTSVIADTSIRRPEGSTSSSSSISTEPVWSPDSRQVAMNPPRHLLDAVQGELDVRQHSGAVRQLVLELGA